MANHLKMAQIQSIKSLLLRGWSRRRVARELGVDRGTVGKIAKRLLADESAQPPPPPDSGVSKSACLAFHDLIESKLTEGLSAERIHADLQREAGFTHSYQSVKRYVRKLKATTPRRIWRMECAPGEEAQIDFGVIRSLAGPNGKARMSNVLRVTLSHSRKGYTETVPQQSTDHFLAVLENAFRRFGGVPATLRIDNLRAAVKQADWYDPELHPKLLAFAAHYETTIIPTRPYTPQHKGKVESDVHYVKENALKGHVFADIAAQNQHLRDWEANVADQRIHGTTKQQVLRQFEQAEKPALRPLPEQPFANFKEAQRTVHRDGYIELDHSYYEVPPEHIGRQVWVRWDTKMVRVHGANMQVIITHVKLQPGNYSRVLGARGRHPTHPYRTSMHWVDQVKEKLGGASQRWATSVAVHRAEQAPRILQGLIELGRRHGAEAVDHACQRALDRGQHHLSHIKENLLRPHQEPDLLAEHPLIRSMQTYQELVANPFTPTHNHDPS